MGSIPMMSVVWDKLNLLLGRVPNCEWVQLRLAAYQAWDLSLTQREFTVIHDHIQACAACAAQYEETVEMVSLLRIAAGRVPQPQIDAEAIADRVLAEISSRESDRAPWQNRVTRPFALVAQKLGFLWKGSGETVLLPKRKGAPARRSLRFKTATVIAVACAVLVAMPVLAYVGQEVWQAFSGSGDTDVASTDTSDSQAPFVLSDGQRASADPNSPTGIDAPEATATARITDDSLVASLDTITEEAIARAYVESLLPHTEEEYEAWAREEYPHIIWLYDVLMGEQGLSQAERVDCPPPANSPAGHLVSFSTSGDGNPTITLPDAEGNSVALSIPIPEGAPWDGIPTNIPDWAQRLYADTPESERPTGWRALLIYSGEIFKFDWPESLDDPNCVPTIEALQAVAAVSGIALDGRATLRATGAFSSQGAMTPDPPSGYVADLGQDIQRAKSVVTYIDVSALMAGTSQFDEISDSASAVLVALCSAPETECSTEPLAKALTNLLDSRDEQVGGVVGGTSAKKRE